MRSVLHPPASAQAQRRLGGQAQGWKMLPAFLVIFRQGETHPHQLPRHLCSLEGTLRPRPVPSACQSSGTGVHPNWECLVPAGLLFYSTPSQSIGRGRPRQQRLTMYTRPVLWLSPAWLQTKAMETRTGDFHYRVGRAPERTRVVGPCGHGIKEVYHATHTSKAILPLP